MQTASRPLLAPRCILFDAVGTLIAADPPVADVYQAVGEGHGALLPRDIVAVRFRASLAKHTSSDGLASSAGERQRWERVVGDVFHEWPAARAPILAELWRHFSQPAAWRLYHDAAAVLEELRERGWPLGVASNFDERLNAVCQGHAPLAELPLFWSSDIGYSKPHPQFFAAVAERLQLQPSEILLVGDDLVADYEGALRAGWQAVLVDREGEPPAAGAIRSLATLPGLLAASPAAD